MTRFELIRSGPYRIFFPLGIVAALLGVGHWVLWTAGWIVESNALFHALVQVEGFLASFVAGFLTTALPRFLGAAPASGLEVVVPFASEIGVIIFLTRYNFIPAQFCFLLMLISLVVFALRRLPRRAKNPPASFILIGFGLIQAFAGPLFMMLGRFGEKSYALMAIGRPMLEIGFLLCLVLGIGGYLAPFLMGYAGDPSCDPQITPLRGTGRLPILFHGLTGAVILASFAGLTEKAAHLGAWARAVVVLLHLLLFAKIWRPVHKHRMYVYFFWVACWMVPLGLWFAALWPEWRIAGWHLLFIGGFSLMIFSFGLLIVLSHGAQADLLNTRLIPLSVVGFAVLMAAVMRVVADIDAWHNRFWLHLASGTWVLAAGFWLIYVFPKLYRIPLTGSSDGTIH